MNGKRGIPVRVTSVDPKTNTFTVEVERLTPNDRPPYAVRRMAMGPTHVVAVDGFTIVATVNHDLPGVAEVLAAAPDLLETLKTARARIHSDICNEECCQDCIEAQREIARAEGQP